MHVIRPLPSTCYDYAIFVDAHLTHASSKSGYLRGTCSSFETRLPELDVEIDLESDYLPQVSVCHVLIA